MITVLKSKLNNLTVTETKLDYEGSITLPASIVRRANLREYEQVHVLNMDNGERIITYIIEDKNNKMEVCMNGPSAHKFSIGDKIIVLAYDIVQPENTWLIEPTKLFFDNDNKLKK